MSVKGFLQVTPRKYVRTTMKPQEDLTARDIPDCIFPTDNSPGVPLLDPNLQGEFLDIPFTLWGTVRQAQAHRGTWHFYREDSGFSAIWRHPHRVANTKCINCVEPNFSCYDDMPMAIAVYQIYRKRWLARYWQHFGIRIFVDLNVSPRYYPLNLLGVPKGWRAWATRAYSERLEMVEVEHEQAIGHAGTDRIHFVVYSGGKRAQELCAQRGWFWFPDEWDKARAMKTSDFTNAHISVKIGSSE